ncbi:MAG: hypothetical protein JEZ07_02585 [Phycisphaerae bacterium]|nr:hypothetical protein [Phycisphaerae bacterium]
MSILIFIIMLLWAQLAYADAKDFADATARKIQAQIETEGSCPETIDGWQSDSGGFLSTWHGRYGIKFPVNYTLNESKDCFTISIVPHIAQRYTITGGPNRKLHYATE